MKKLKKLTRGELRTISGGATSSRCWVHVRKSKGLEVEYGETGGGTCPSPPSGWGCKYFTAMGSC